MTDTLADRTDMLTDRTEVLTDRRPGRPRDTSLESTVLSATADLLLERDTKDVTIAAITERSGVSRAAVYRRWSSREELLAAALDSVRSSIELIPGPPRWKRSSTATNSPRSPSRGAWEPS
jgi:hypothetical protein